MILQTARSNIPVHLTFSYSSFVALTMPPIWSTTVNSSVTRSAIKLFREDRLIFKRISHVLEIYHFLLGAWHVMSKITVLLYEVYTYEFIGATLSTHVHSLREHIRWRSKSH